MCRLAVLCVLVMMTSQHDRLMGNINQHEGGVIFLKQLRSRLGLSQEGLAQALGVSAGTISRWERGLAAATFTVPQMKKFFILLDQCQISIDSIPDDLSALKAEDWRGTLDSSVLEDPQQQQN